MNNTIIYKIMKIGKLIQNRDKMGTKQKTLKKKNHKYIFNNKGGNIFIKNCVFQIATWINV